MNRRTSPLKRMKDEGAVVDHSVSRIGMDDETQELFDSLVDG